MGAATKKCVDSARTNSKLEGPVRSDLTIGSYRTVTMSLSLIQGYSSAEEQEEELQSSSDDDKNENENENDDVPRRKRYKPLFDPNPSSSSSSLPSALHVFSEISGPPEFLNNSVEETGKDVERHGRRKYSRNKNDLPAGAVVEAKPQLVGIHDRVRSDVDGSIPRTETGQANVSVGTVHGGKPPPTASYPGAEDAAELLRLCLSCGIPKTYSHSRGMVCPACGDRPVDTDQEQAKKKGSAIKDREKNKRMKGQSSHATWKSETEMQLRQQFD